MPSHSLRSCLLRCLKYFPKTMPIYMIKLLTCLLLRVDHVRSVIQVFPFCSTVHCWIQNQLNFCSLPGHFQQTNGRGERAYIGPMWDRAAMLYYLHAHMCASYMCPLGLGSLDLLFYHQSILQRKIRNIFQHEVLFIRWAASTLLRSPFTVQYIRRRSCNKPPLTPRFSVIWLGVCVYVLVAL